MSAWMKIFFAMTLLLVVMDGAVDWKRSQVYAETKSCHYIKVKTASGALVNLYSDASLTMAIPNPFVVTGDRWEIHTAGVGDLKIEEMPCR